jgi:membrane protein DedA with SNARE-associated domain
MPGMSELLIIMFIGVVGLGFWIYALVDVVKNEPAEGNDRLIWILVVALAGWIGATVYWVVRRPQRRALIGR